MHEYSLYSTTGSIGTGPWVKTFDPVVTTTEPTEAWYTEDEEEAQERAEQNEGFAVGPRPKKPH